MLLICLYLTSQGQGGAFTVVYCDPVKTTLKPNVESAPALDDAVSVNVAEVDAPTAKLDDVGVQVNVRYVPAFAGLQVFVDMLSVLSATFPVFLR
jgi:hypothetical protein